MVGEAVGVLEDAAADHEAFDFGVFSVECEGVGAVFDVAVDDELGGGADLVAELDDGGDELVKVIVQFIYPTLVIALLCSEGVDFGGDAHHAGDVTGFGLCARHAAQTSSHEEHTVDVATFLATLHELLAGCVEHRDGRAVHDTLRADVHIGARGHLTILAHAQGVVTLPVVGLAVVGNDHTVGDNHAGCVLVRGEQA